MDGAISMTNLDKTIRVFVLDADSDDAYDMETINNIGKMRKIVKCEDAGIDRMEVMGRPFFVMAAGAYVPGRKVSAFDSNGKQLLAGNLIFAGIGTNEDGAPILRSVTDEEVGHLLKNVVMMRHIGDENDRETYTMYCMINVEGWPS